MNPGPVPTGLGTHIVRGLRCHHLVTALCCWLPWLRTAEHAIQTIVYCATDAGVAQQSGLYYADCAVQLTPDKAADMDAAYRLWEMSERMAALTS